MTKLLDSLLALNVMRIGKHVVVYSICLLLFVTSNSLYSRLDWLVMPLNWALIACSLALVAFLWASRRVDADYLKRWACWGIVVTVSFLLPALAGDSIGIPRIRFFEGFLLVFPLAIHLVRQSGDFEFALRAFADITVVFAAASLVLWVLGPISDMLDPNCVIDSTWVPGPERQVLGYDHLLYLTQFCRFDEMRIWRNTGIFTEGPMYSFVLSVALVFELVGNSKPRKAHCVILGATTLSTMSTTGIIVLIAVSAFHPMALRFVREVRKRPLVVAFAAAVALVALAVMIMLVVQKVSTSSGAIRIDDFVAGFLSWSHSPLLGNGLGNYAALRTYMADFRLSNTGFSNSPFWDLFQGGLVYAFPHMIALGGYFVSKPKAPCVMAGLCFVFLWVVTVVALLPLTALVMSFGVDRICSWRMKDTANHGRV